MESKAILYHSNKQDECNKFISQEEYLILSGNSRDDVWLGKGMYFWDNRGNAEWWNKKQSKRNPNITYTIVAANALFCAFLWLSSIPTTYFIGNYYEP